MIIVSESVIQQWRTASAHALGAARRPCDPAVVALLAAADPRIGEVVSFLSETLARTAGTLLGSAQIALDADSPTFLDGLTRLAAEVAQAQEADLAAEKRGEPGFLCPLPNVDGSAFRCGCPPEAADACSAAAFDVGADELEEDLDALVADDRAARGDDGCEGGAR